MNVTCPQCHTVYRLPDDKVKPGVKLRCSVCRHIFALSSDEQTTPSERQELSLDGGERSVPSDGGRAEKTSSGYESGELSLDAGPSSSGLALAVDGEPMARANGRMAVQGLRLEGADSAASFGGLDMPRRKRSPLSGIVMLLVCVALGGGGWWMWQNTPYLDGLKGLIAPYVGLEMADASDPLSLVSKLELRDVRQYQIKNEKVGQLIVIEGKVKNNFPTARELIRLEAELYDASGNMLASRQQLAGNSMSSFQLEVLDKEELDKALNNKLDIVEANTNVLPGSEVPFTVVFVEPPAEASDFKVRIAEAALPQHPGNLSE